jgi:DNA invertase Pin-like site-specific DNA recombinase
MLWYSEMAKVAIYARVSTFDQTCEKQKRELGQWAARAGHEVVKIYEDAGISGTKGRDKRQGFDALLKGAVRREFDMIAVWSSDRLGRSMPICSRYCRRCVAAELGSTSTRRRLTRRRRVAGRYSRCWASSPYLKGK